MTDLIILATLLPGPKHGYQLKHEAGLIIGQQAIHNNLVYPLLRRFMSKGWVSKKVVPGERGQTRQQYTLTAAGRKELIARLSTFDEQEARSGDEFRVRVGLFAVLPHEVRERILKRRKEYLHGQTEKFARLQENIEVGTYGGEVIDHLRQMGSLQLKWIERLQRLEKSEA
ncbi:MAG TPA: helix-turn-helix transcriptional regulator [Terriglobales bacterium]